MNLKTALFVTMFACTGPLVRAQSDSYLPLAEGSKWVLRSPAMGAPVTFEVVGAKTDKGFRIKATNPWGSSEFTLSQDGPRYLMTQFGNGKGMMNLPDLPVFLNFAQDAGKRWSNSLGTLENTARNVTVKTQTGDHKDTVRLRHSPKGGDPIVYTFAKGVGFVQFGEGNSAFVLDESASSLPGRRAAAAAPAPDRSQRVASSAPSSNTPSRSRTVDVPAPVTTSRPLIGLTPNRFANEANTPDNLIKRFQQTVSTGVKYLVGNSTWAELEPSPGQFNLSSLNYLTSVARDNQLALSYTVRAIDTIHKSTPSDLQKVRWSDPKMRDRALRLVEAIAPALKGQTRWFMFGYEIDPYMEQHSGEVADFVSLFKAVKARAKELMPGVQVGVTITFTGIDSLATRLKPLNPELDILTLTYTPLLPNWVVDNPEVLPRDFAKMSQVAAGRKIVLQEIAYPTAAINQGSEEKQARFYDLAFQEWGKNDGRFAAASFMMLADLSDSDANNLGAFYGMTDSKAFKAVLQSLGMFDTNGRPKASWKVFQEHVK